MRLSIAVCIYSFSLALMGWTVGNWRFWVALALGGLIAGAASIDAYKEGKREAERANHG